MSQENVEIVRLVYEAEARRDVEAVLALYDPDIEFDNSRSPVGDFAETVGRVFRGRGAVQNAFREWYDAWVNVESEVEELIDAGADRVVSVFTYRARGRTSGVEVEFPHMAGDWTIRNGKVIRVAFLPSRKHALEAMSKEAVEVVRQALEAVAREDWSGLTAFVSQECELHDFDIPDVEVRHGPDGVLDWIADWGAAWESWSLHDLDFRPVGDDRVLVLWRFVAKGKGSGIELSRDDAIAFTLREGRISRVEYYNDQQQALEAVGLGE